MESKALVFLWLAAAACGRSEGTVEAAAPGPLVGAFEPALDPGRVLEGYSWDGASLVPWLSDRPPDVLQHGELGRTPLTGLYLTFNQDLEREARVQPEGWTVEASALGPSVGRFGPGVRLGRSSRLACALPAGGLQRAWTLEFWLFPASLPASQVLALPGLLSVRCEAGGQLVLEMPGAGVPDENGPQPLVVHHTQPLVAGQWNHVGVVLDVSDVRGVRLVVNGVPRGSKLDPTLAHAPPKALLVGDVAGNGSGLDGALDELRFLGCNTSTAELERHWQLARRPVERLRLRYATGSEELELWQAPLTDPRLDSADEWKRGALAHAFVAPEGLSWSREAWHLVDCPERPAARTTHPVVALPGRRVFTFGGETRDTHWGRGPDTDDTWIFDGQRETWTRVPTTLAPSPRCHMQAAYSPDHDLVLLVGGWWQGGWWQGAEAEERLTDTWVFHVGEQRWEQRDPDGTELGVTSDNGLVYLPDQKRFLLLMGNSARLYDPAQDRWEKATPFRVVDEAGNPVRNHRPVSYMAALDPESGLVLVFGGSVGKEVEIFVDSTALFDPRTGVLTVLAPSVHPSARVRSAFAYDPKFKRFVLFGGVRDQHSERFDDLWTFDPRTRQWSEVAREAERPGRRGGFMGMAYDAEAQHFVVPCGRCSFERWSDETWTLELDERRAGSARYVFDRAAFPEARSWFAEVEAPADSAVRFRFRASGDGQRFGPWSDTPADGRFVQVEVVLEPGASGARPLVRALGFR